MRLPPVLRVWLPPLLLMAVIFALSAQPNLSTGLGDADKVGRKFVHVAEYAGLCVLWWRALGTIASHRKALVFASAISFAYAVSDEFHQSFVPGREGRPRDVAIDAIGIALAALWIRRRSTPRGEPAPAREPDPARVG